MSRVSVEAKATYSQKAKTYLTVISKIRHHERNILTAIQQDPLAQKYMYIKLAEGSLVLASNYLLLNRISVALLGIRNDSFLKEARKSCSECIIYLEKIITDQIDIPFSELTEHWESIKDYPDADRYKLMCKLGFTIEATMAAFGENSKWKWSFIDLMGRFAVVYKNIIDFRSLLARLNPSEKDYEYRVKMLRKVKEFLAKSAEDIRLKYELTTNRLDDFRTAIRMYSALYRIHTLIGEPDLAEGVKKKITLWKQKMESDAERQKQQMGSKERS